MFKPVVLDWYVVATKPKGEEHAVRSLERLGLKTFVPRHWVETRRGGKRATAQRRLFPGYVFTGLPSGFMPWREICECYGVHGIVGFGNPVVPERIPQWIVGNLVSGEITGAFDVRAPADRYVPDAEVKALTGAFASFCGTIAERRSDDRVVVLFSLFGRPAPIEMTLDALELVA